MTEIKKEKRLWWQEFNRPKIVGQQRSIERSTTVVPYSFEGPETVDNPKIVDGLLENSGKSVSKLLG